MTFTPAPNPTRDPYLRVLRIVLILIAVGALVYLLMRRHAGGMNAVLERFPRVGQIGSETHELRPPEGAEPETQVISFKSVQPPDAVRAQAEQYLQDLSFTPLVPPTHAGVWRYQRGRQIVTLTLGHDEAHTYVAVTLTNPRE